jgi:hypothetical protein
MTFHTIANCFEILSWCVWELVLQID